MAGPLFAAVVMMSACGKTAVNDRGQQKDAGTDRDATPDAGDAPADTAAPDAGAPDVVPADGADGAASCDYLFTPHALGEEFPAGDGCNTCTCRESGVTCTQKNCWTDAGQTPCSPGIDRTCNEDPTQIESRGVCLANGTCDCGNQLQRSPFTGRCLTMFDSSGDGCEYLGLQADHHPVGSQFDCGGNCDLCRCDAPGVISRVPVACDPAAGVLPCFSDWTYVFGDLGGSSPFQEQTTLPIWGSDSVPLLSTRVADGATNVCWSDFPPCGAPGVVDLSDLLLDIHDPTVQAVLGQRPAPVLLGRDTRPEGTAVFSFVRADGAGFLVGGDCAGAAGCTPVPAAITRLMGDSKAFAASQRKSVDCDPWPTPGTFPCFNLSCKIGTEYCTTGAFDGKRKYAECRPYPPGCSTCGCAKTDTASVPRPDPCFPVCESIRDGDSSPTLRIACTS